MEDRHIVEMEEPEVIEAEEAAVAVGAAGEDEVAHEVVKFLDSTYRCISQSLK